MKQQKWLYRKFKFLTDMWILRRDGKPVLAVSNRELLATDYYRKSPHSEKQWVKARRQAGVDEMLSQQGSGAGHQRHYDGRGYLSEQYNALYQ